MRRLLPHVLALLAGGSLAVGIAACGSTDRTGLIPPGDAEALASRLSAVEDAVAAGNCVPLTQDLVRLRGALATLPTTVDARLRARLADGIRNLQQIAPGACTKAAEAETTTVDTTTTPTETTATETTPTTTTTTLPTTTSPTTTTPPTTPPTTPTTTTTPEGTGGVAPPTGGATVPGTTTGTGGTG